MLSAPQGQRSKDREKESGNANRLHGDPGIELRTVGAALAQLLRRRLSLRWEPLSGVVPRIRRSTIEAAQENKTTSSRFAADWQKPLHCHTSGGKVKKNKSNAIRRF